MGRNFLSKNRTDHKPRSYFSPRNFFVAYPGLLDTVSTRVLRVYRQCTARITIFTMFFLILKRFLFKKSNFWSKFSFSPRPISLCTTSRQCAVCGRSFGINSTTLWNQLNIINIKVAAHQKCAQAQGKKHAKLFLHVLIFCTLNIYFLMQGYIWLGNSQFVVLSLKILLTVI